NPQNLPHLPEKENIEIPFFGMYPVTTKHVIALQNDVSTKYQAYINVQNELTAAYNELRNELAKQKFNKTFAELNDEGKKAILAIYPRRISEAEELDYYSQPK
ncbi:MAG: biopolymer transporter ExbD, partial [Bacteroidaceae bacterium]|nr:biopolymer transporter ExbD [Bacteroidaceae bacterium]